MKLSRSVFILITGIALIAFQGLFIRCAHPVMPSGGPKDITPPQVVSTDPLAGTVNFTGKKISILFKEFIQLKDPGKEIFISPPMKMRPDFMVRGKSLLIGFNEKLKRNVTYTLYFGNAITDITEGNILAGYEYVFSTGDKIDSLSVDGTVVNAFNLNSEKDVLVMVYLDDNDTIPLDSLPYRIPPRNVTRTDSSGHFRLNNLSREKYKIFALKDLNNNYIYDLPGEMIAFADSLVTPVLIKQPIPDRDTASSKTEGIKTEQIKLDSVPPGMINLLLFEETDSLQKVLDASFIGNRRVQYAFRFPVDSVRIRPLNFNPDGTWMFKEFNARRDTLICWIKPGLPDTMRLEIRTGRTVCDTNRFVVKKGETGNVFKKRKKEVAKLTVSPNLIGGKMDLNQQLVLTFSGPLAAYDFSKIWLYSKTDTINPGVSTGDPAERRITINYPWKPEQAYVIFFPDSVFRNIYGEVNDSTKISFRTKKPEDYGNIILNILIPSFKGQYIIQLMNSKEGVLQESIIKSPQVVRFDFINPGNYRLKVIYDNDRNGKWDSGNYNLKIQPEKVEFFPKTLSVRANWELQETWGLK
jgi:hypothetical protein